MKKKTLYLVGSFILVISLAVVLLTAVKGGEAPIGESTETSKQCLWGASADIDPSIADDALVVIDESLLGSATVKCVDLKTGKKRVFCTRPNCRHSDDKCISYFPGSVFSSTVQDAAMIGDKIFCFALVNAT